MGQWVQLRRLGLFIFVQRFQSVGLWISGSKPSKSQKWSEIAHFCDGLGLVATNTRLPQYLPLIDSVQDLVYCGKLTLPEPPSRYVPRRIAQQNIRPLSITHAHALAVSALPMYHLDPFDRLLIAQAQSENMTILTADAVFRQYDVALLWCGA